MNLRLFASPAAVAAIFLAAACGSSSTPSGSGGSSSTTGTTSGTGGTGAGEPGPCQDGMKSGGETDIDCGGPCPRCEDGKVCKTSADCLSNTCIGDKCVEPACDDQVKDGKETDIDCGGSCSSACADGKGCQVAADCASLVCTAFVCQASTCKDGAKNGSETGVDCGGACPRCPDGQPCVNAVDCQSTLCDAMVCASNLVWQKGAGDAAAQAVTGVAVDGTGATLVIGTFSGTIDLGGGPLVSAGGTDIFLAKLDPAGAVAWSKRFGDASDQVGAAIAVDDAGTIYITGSVKGTVDFGLGPLANGADPLDAYLAIFSSSGTAIFSKRYATAFPQAGAVIAVNSAHEVLLGGTFTTGADFGCGMLPGAGGTDVFLAKISAQGACIWAKRYGDAADQEVLSVAYDGSGNVLAGGRFAGSIAFGGSTFTMVGAARGGFAAKLDPQGAHLFSTSLGNLTTEQEVDGIAADPSGNVLLSGLFSGSIDLGGAALVSSGGSDLFVAKLDAGGSHVWSRSAGDATDQAGRAQIAADSLGQVILAGDFHGAIDFGVGPLLSAGDADLFVAKLDPDGNGLFARRYGDASAQQLTSFARAGDKAMVIGGAFQGSLDLGGAALASAGQTDALVARLTTP